MDKMLKHEDMKRYISGEVDNSLLKEIRNLKKDCTLFQIFFDWIDHIDKQALALTAKISVDRNEIDFSSIEVLIEEIILGTVNSNKKTRVAALLYHSPVFYYRLVTKLHQVQQLLDGAEAKEIGEINVMTDNQILNIIRNKIEFNSDKNESQLKKSDKGEQKSINIWTLPAFRRFIYAAAAILLIVPSIYFLYYQYNTTYKNHIAQNLLHENYQIYINDQPRLSGAYQSTGISQLMADEEGDLEYLKSSDKLITETLTYSSKDARALHLKAQILIIQKQYDRADSILNVALSQDFKSSEMLNDLGAVYFAKKEWQKAKTFFKLSLKENPNFPEAYYNLALTEFNLGNAQNARDVVDYYLKLEKDPGWINAGLNLISTMEGD
ncbi:MAG: tetratricopeptide repeat protein [Calditrichaceae bacterium]|nr:tetratricopeptide repeat protein [Calditrichaceae bacterium]